MLERSIEVNAPIETVYGVISDLESYPEFLSTTKSVKLKKLNSGCDAEFKINVIKDISYTLRFRFDPPRELHWAFIKGELMKENRGAWLLEPIGETKTKAIYQIDVRFGWMVPKLIVKKLTETQLPQLLASFKKRAEQFSEEG